MNKMIFIVLSGFISQGYAYDIHQRIELTDEQKFQIFTKHGLPAPGTGVHLIPASAMSPRIAAKLNKNFLSISNRGYVDEENQGASTLLQIKELAASDLKKSLKSNNPQSTHMHINAKDVHTAYEYSGVTYSIVKQVIGFAAMGAYLPNQGWTGAVEFFEPKNLSNTNCSYKQSNIKLTGGSANIAQEIVSYVVNNKISVVEVIGNNKSGFGYNVEWYDDNYRHELLCAQKEYSKNTIKKVVEMAKIIDASMKISF